MRKRVCIVYLIVWLKAEEEKHLREGHSATNTGFYVVK